jgi:hypothetical protein
VHIPGSIISFHKGVGNNIVSFVTTLKDHCKQLHSIKDDDGLDSLVNALPPSYTSRFGEIVWAAGGNGFGWWPACIYEYVALQFQTGILSNTSL